MIIFALDVLPRCVPNECPNLKDKMLNHGAWACKNSEMSQSCLNHRLGMVCNLHCDGGFTSALGHVSVCTESGSIYNNKFGNSLKNSEKHF